MRQVRNVSGEQSMPTRKGEIRKVDEKRRQEEITVDKYNEKKCENKRRYIMWWNDKNKIKREKEKREENGGYKEDMA